MQRLSYTACRVVSLGRGKTLSSGLLWPQLWLQQLLLPSQGKERGSCPLPAHAGLWLCSSLPVAPDSSAFTVRHLSLLQQTLPFLGSKGFLELPSPKLGSTCHGKSSMENWCQPSLAPCPDGGASPGAYPTERLGRCVALSTTAAFLGTVGVCLLCVRKSLWRCMGLSVGQVLLNP